MTYLVSNWRRLHIGKTKFYEAITIQNGKHTAFITRWGKAIAMRETGGGEILLKAEGMASWREKKEEKAKRGYTLAAEGPLGSFREDTYQAAMEHDELEKMLRATIGASQTINALNMLSGAAFGKVKTGTFEKPDDDVVVEEPSPAEKLEVAKKVRNKEQELRDRRGEEWGSW